MRKQRLPKDFWTGVNLADHNTYCFWYDGSTLKKCQVLTEKEARNFIARAEEKHVAAFASAYVEEEDENQVFICSFNGILKQYEFKDYVCLEISSANYKLIHYPEKKANRAAATRSIEQWSKKEYDMKYDDAEYHVSWYNVTLHKFEGTKYVTIDEAEAKFSEKQKADMPVRLIETIKGSKRIHEIKAACQHWHIGMGTYLEQVADKTLPIGEIPYIFSNHYLTSEMKVEGEYGYLDFRVGFNNYSIQMSQVCHTGSKNSMSVMIDKLFDINIMYYVIIDDNPIVAPWLARIERQW